MVNTFPINLMAHFPNRMAFFPNRYNNKMPPTIAFITRGNDYFESQKPEFAMQCPIFFDWVDHSNTLRNYKMYANFAGILFYNEVYNMAKHTSDLPQLVVTMKGVNDLKITIKIMDEAIALARFQYRLWVAPFTKITFSSNAPLLDLGFTPAQFGQRTVFKQVKIINNMYHYRIWVSTRLVPAS